MWDSSCTASWLSLWGGRRQGTAMHRSSCIIHRSRTGRLHIRMSLHPPHCTPWHCTAGLHCIVVCAGAGLLAEELQPNGDQPDLSAVQSTHTRM